MKYMSDYKNQAWSLKLEKSSVRTISLCPLFGDHLFHLVHLPVVLLVHQHLNDNHHLPSTQWPNILYCRQHAEFHNVTDMADISL